MANRAQGHTFKTSTPSPTTPVPVDRFASVAETPPRLPEVKLKYTKESLKVSRLVKAFQAGSLLRNAEYQRGEQWRLQQKAGFVDSIFRNYPVPPLFLLAVENEGLDDTPVKKWEIVDGQQRLIALRDFRVGQVRLLKTDKNSKLRLPGIVRERPAPWAGYIYDELTDDLRNNFDNALVDVYRIDPDTHPDEVRDLFIRLQSGTALSRQQVRDAWPGNLGPFIESIAGKLQKKPSQRIFALVDRRGTRVEEDERDEFVTSRQLAAQFIRIFKSREPDSFAYPSVSASELDGLYHAETDWDVRSPLALRFLELLDHTAQVLERLRAIVTGQRKFRKVDVFIIFMYLHDVTKGPRTKISSSFLSATAAAFATASSLERPVTGKGTSASALKSSYEWWRKHSPDSSLVRLDPRRLFDTKQKRVIWEKSNGICNICNMPVELGDAEYDHHPIPHRDGGPTEVSNGRLVHDSCHPRGRPADDY